jgi:hypothetical protein
MSAVFLCPASQPRSGRVCSSSVETGRRLARMAREQFDFRLTVLAFAQTPTPRSNGCGRGTCRVRRRRPARTESRTPSHLSLLATRILSREHLRPALPIHALELRLGAFLVGQPHGLWREGHLHQASGVSPWTTQGKPSQMPEGWTPVASTRTPGGRRGHCISALRRSQCL